MIKCQKIKNNIDREPVFIEIDFDFIISFDFRFVDSTKQLALDVIVFTQLSQQNNLTCLIMLLNII